MSRTGLPVIHNKLEESGVEIGSGRRCSLTGLHTIMVRRSNIEALQIYNCFCGTGWSAYELLRALRCNFKLNWVESTTDWLLRWTSDKPAYENRGKGGVHMCFSKSLGTLLNQPIQIQHWLPRCPLSVHLIQTLFKLIDSVSLVWFLLVSLSWFFEIWSDLLAIDILRHFFKIRWNF